MTTPSGLVLDEGLDRVSAPTDWADEVPGSLVDFLEFYLLNYSSPEAGRRTLAHTP